MASSARVVVMRHSRRLDEDSAATWVDKATRPYDTPIADRDLPVATATELRARGIPVSAIVSSPFRRCLNTAGEVARTLGIREVSVDMALAEMMEQVRLTLARCGSAATAVEYLDEAAMQAELGDGVALAGVTGVAPPLAELASQTVARYNAVVSSRLTAAATTDAPTAVLLVTHGYCINAAGSARGLLVYAVPECSWVVVDATTAGFVAQGGGVEHMTED
jgi:broad specificity phosphatase PhoE